MSDAKKPDAPAAPAEPKKSGGSKLVPILVGVNSLVMMGVLGLLVMQTMNKGAAPAGKKEETAEHGEKKDDAKAEEHGEKKEEAKAEEHGEKKEAGGEHGEKKEEGGEHAAKPSSSSSSGAMGPLVKVSDFVVHLRNPEVDRYARISFDVEVIADSDKEALNKSMSKVRDAFISYLSDRTVEELRGSDGLHRTKDALQTKLRELVPDTRVRALYISDFVIQ